MKKTILNRILRLEKQVDALKAAQTVSTEHFAQLDLRQVARMVDILATSRHRSESDYQNTCRDFKAFRWITIAALVVAAIALCVAMLK